MKIEHRVNCALDDLNDLILEGIPIDEALQRAAEPYDIRAEALRARIALSGDTADYIENIQASHARSSAKWIIEKAIREAVEQDYASGRNPSQRQISEILREIGGQEPSTYELAFAAETRASAIERHQQRVLAIALNAGRKLRLDDD